MQYALDEIRTLVSKIPQPLSPRDPTARYVAALFAELAYYHVPQFEIDAAKRALVVPCEAYRAIVRAGVATDIIAVIRGLDFPGGFVVVERGSLAVGLPIGRILFIGFRGTKFLFDWRINLRSELVHVEPSFRSDGKSIRWMPGGRLHRGFSEEAIRISARIVDAINDNRLDVDQVVLSGHSLGGAVAALSEKLLWFKAISTITLGAPRYCDAAAYYETIPHPPTQIQREGDFVPLVPRRRAGYADHPYQFDTAGKQILQPANESSMPSLLWALLLFAARHFEPHDMEQYRRELGHTAGAPLANEALTP